MVLAIASAGIGFVLHFRANAEFQLDIDPSMRGLALWMKVLQAKAPPALAPGVMASSASSAWHTRIGIRLWTSSVKAYGGYTTLATTEDTVDTED